MSKIAKRKRNEEEDVAMGDSEEVQKQRLLELLDEQCRQSTGIAFNVPQNSSDEESELDQEDGDDWKGIIQEELEGDLCEQATLATQLIPTIFHDTTTTFSKRTLRDALTERDNFMVR